MTETERLIKELDQWIYALEHRGAYKERMLAQVLRRVTKHLEATCAHTPDTTATPDESPPDYNESSTTPLF